MVSIHPKLNGDFIRFFSNDDEKLQELGQILRTPTSRAIWQLLQGKDLRNSEIARTLKDDSILKLSNFTHHLQKMVDVGLIVSTKRLHKGRELLFYSAVPIIVITPSEHLDKARISKTLKSVFRNIFKITAIGTCALLAYQLQNPFAEILLNSTNQSAPDYTLALLIIIGGLITERVLHSKLKLFNKYRISNY